MCCMNFPSCALTSALSVVCRATKPCLELVQSVGQKARRSDAATAACQPAVDRWGDGCGEVGTAAKRKRKLSNVRRTKIHKLLSVEAVEQEAAEEAKRSAARRRRSVGVILPHRHGL